MRILVYGAGPLGSLFAARLHQGGHDVKILARGQRLEDIRQSGIIIHDVLTDETVTAQVPAVTALAPDDVYDLVLVIMRKNAALEILPVLAANVATPNVLFLMNNAAGPEALVKAVGRDRVLIGFPNSGGYRDGPVMHVLSGTPAEPSRVPFGEVDGQVTDRTRRVAEALKAAPGLGAEIRSDMDAWLKYHVALLMPSIAPALYLAGTDHKRLARTRDAVVLGARAIREGFAVLRSLGYPVTPRQLGMFAWLPEPILVPFAQRLMADPKMKVALEGHAEAARDELQHLCDEFLALAADSPVPIPTIRRLYRAFDPDSPRLPDGSRALPLDWTPVIAAGAVLAGVAALVGGIWRRAAKGTQAARKATRSR